MRENHKYHERMEQKNHVNGSLILSWFGISSLFFISPSLFAQSTHSHALQILFITKSLEKNFIRKKQAQNWFWNVRIICTVYRMVQSLNLLLAWMLLTVCVCQWVKKGKTIYIINVCECVQMCVYWPKLIDRNRTLYWMRYMKLFI